MTENAAAIEQAWRDAGLPPHFLGSRDMLRRVCDFAKSFRAAPTPQDAGAVEGLVEALETVVGERKKWSVTYPSAVALGACGTAADAALATFRATQSQASARKRAYDDGARIVAGLDDAIAFYEGDTSRADLISTQSQSQAPAREGDAEREAIIGRLNALAKDAWVGSVEEWTSRAILAMGAAARALSVEVPTPTSAPSQVVEGEGSGLRRDKLREFVVNWMANRPVSKPIALLADAIIDNAAALRTHKRESNDEGWRLVPEEATGAMWSAGQEADEHPGDSYSAVWAAMLAAAPQSEEHN